MLTVAKKILPNERKLSAVVVAYSSQSHRVIKGVWVTFLILILFLTGMAFDRPVYNFSSKSLWSYLKVVFRFLIWIRIGSGFNQVMDQNPGGQK
jgi:hypothetical protein